MADAKKLFPFILKWEGGFVNDPNDLGGATNMGITINTFVRWRKSQKKDVPTVDDLKKISKEEVFEIFKAEYWDKYKADQIKNQKVANCLVDWLWLSGLPAIKRVQTMLGLKADGLVGPLTIGAINKTNTTKLLSMLYKDRENYIDAICKARPANEKFRKGWMNRLNSLKTFK